MYSPTVVGHSDLLGHEVRLEEWSRQGESTYVRAREALAAGDPRAAVQLAELTVQEAEEAYTLYSLWLRRTPEVLLQLGVPAADTAKAQVQAAEVAECLRTGWFRYREHIAELAVHAAAGDTDRAQASLEDARTTWQSAHDAATDEICGLIAVGVNVLGEASVGRLWDELLAHYYEALPDKYDPATQPWTSSLERLALDIFEATRGHLSGSLRDGSFAVREEEDRWVVQFEPCGSGGRTYPGAEVPTTRSTFTESEHDWAWRTIGVCHYCVHCCQLQQRAPIERIGIPLRVIEPPVLAGPGRVGRSLCTWSLYKDPARLPVEAFTKVGAPVPPWLASTDSPLPTNGRETSEGGEQAHR